ncbi:MAG: hypothetical protein CR982_06065 [Candidatus Cloacimonadota bacterium]|nr:MAG: hypothetical protein CR982_06065 [Candidatus Cloacimonadota bacterium]PIE78085.1 MAG: hypothetical protein CSA15_09625 [Candidatus Delongbacteria bacterium]
MRSDKIIPVFDKMKATPSFFAIKDLDEEDIKEVTDFYEFFINSQNERGSVVTKLYLDKIRD